MKEELKYDVVLIGGGLGALLCSYILGSEGKKVCIIEKNKQLGGSLQIFSRDKVMFDTGLHYVGGLDEGQNLYQYFKYFGILDDIELHKLDEDCADLIVMEDGKKKYKYAQGYENFIQQLVSYFPNEEKGIRNFCQAIKDVCNEFPMYNLEYDDQKNIQEGIIMQSAVETIASFTENQELRDVLGATNVLYAGSKETTPFYVHALVVNSYIESSYRIKGGGAAVIKSLVKNIRKFDGEFIKNSKVVGFDYDGTNISAAILEDGRKIKGDNFISNIHPKNTLDLIEPSRLRKSYRNRIESMENTPSCFIANIVFKKNTFKYLNYNVYYFSERNVWDSVNQSDENFPLGFMASFAVPKDDIEYADGVSVLCYMDYNEVKEWENTFNTVNAPSDRTESYQAFKKIKEEQIIKRLENYFPNIRSCIQSIYSSTPLTFKDYIGTDDGNLYGVIKDYKNPLKTFLTPKTKIPNLFLTGQNINLHGVLGVTISSVITCSYFIDKKYLLDKIKAV